MQSLAILFFLCAFQKTQSLVSFKFSVYTLKYLLHFLTFCSSQVQHKEKFPTYFIRATSGHWSLRFVQEMARKSQIFWESPSFLQYRHLPLPAPSHWTHLSNSCNAIETIHTLWYQPSPTLLPHPPSLFLQNHFFITSFHLCAMNKSSGLYLTDLKVNSKQMKCSPSWLRTVWNNTLQFSHYLLAQEKKTPKITFLQENSRRGIFTVMLSHPACSTWI